MQRRRLYQPLARVKRLRGHYVIVVKRGPPERGTEAHDVTRKPIQDGSAGPAVRGVCLATLDVAAVIPPP